MSNFQTKNGYNSKGRSNKVYKPKKPFRSVEGIESPAWEQLSVHAIWILMEFYKCFDGYNRNCLYLSYKTVGHKVASDLPPIIVPPLELGPQVQKPLGPVACNPKNCEAGSDYIPASSSR